MSKQIQMRVLIISGFLGSGKTTLVLQLARRLSSSGKKCAIIENELGEIGIDGRYLTLEGLQVQELFGGCICCTLSANLITTLQELHERFGPELVIMEATGLADPGDIAAKLKSSRLKISSIKVITLLDAGRYAMLMEMMTPLMTAQILAANTLIINKIDRVELESLELIRKEITGLNPKAHINALSLANQPDLETIMDRLSL